MDVINFRDTAHLAEHLKATKPTLYVGSQTSTVVPYDQLDQLKLNLTIGSLANLPKKIELDNNNNLKISGPVSWQEAKQFCLSKGRKVMTSPTEELALCLAGIATSATGERCYKFGTLRDQISQVTFMDRLGEQTTLYADKAIEELAVFDRIFDSPEKKALLSEYQQTYQKYQNLKNAPFPRLEKQTDIMVGTEGQLGIVTGATFKTTELHDEMYIFMKLPNWEKDISVHMEVFEKVQKFRDVIESCEFIDENSLAYLPDDERPTGSGDLLFLEVPENQVEDLYDSLLSQLDGVSPDDIFEMNPAKCRQLRMSVPRYIFEENQKMKVVKMGTDVQVTPDKFPALMKLYQAWQNKGVTYNMFGHFGDAHLHFNFMPRPEQTAQCKELLLQFYQDVAELGGSPFAEHGVGVLKQDYIRPYYQAVHFEIFSLLKDYYDPENCLFPGGYMSMGK